MNLKERMAREGQENRKDIYLCIIRYIKEHCYSPSNKEIAESLQMSTTTVRKHIDELIEDGLLETDAEPGASRAFRVSGYQLGRRKKNEQSRFNGETHAGS